jgi:ATP-dependent DNA helicase RecG
MIVLAMKENKEITIGELAQILGVSSRAIQKQIGKLKKEKIIERIGADKGGYWKVIKEE